MTLGRVWVTYCEVHPDGYSYGHFCELYMDRSNKQLGGPAARPQSRDKLIVVFAGATIDSIGSEPEGVSKAQIFEATMGCTRCTYVETVTISRDVIRTVLDQASLSNEELGEGALCKCVADVWSGGVRCVRTPTDGPVNRTTKHLNTKA